MKVDKIENALIALAKCIDTIEDGLIAPHVKKSPHFKTRQQLIEEILK